MKKLLLLLLIIILGVNNIFALTSFCYQETTNKSSSIDGNCNLSYDGNYEFLTTGATLVNGNNFYDGNWSTYTYADSSGFSAGYNITYIKPNGSNYGSKLEIKPYNESIMNITIPSNCWSYNESYVKFELFIGGVSNFTRLNCFKSGGTEQILYLDGGSTSNFYEEAMLWNMSTNFIENSQTFNNNTSGGNLEQFIINITFDPTYSINSANLIYNNTQYSSDSINQIGNNYIISKSINVPSVTTKTNMTFYWQINLSSGINYTSTRNNQSVSTFSIDNCEVNTNLLINYTLYDEQTQNLIPDSTGIIIDTTIDVYDFTYNYLVYNYSYRSTTNNSKFCISDLTNSSGFYIDVQTQYYASGYATELNHIQKYLVNNLTIPIQVNLYDLNYSYAQEFTIKFKDSNFAPKGNVLVDVSRKYIDEGIFKSVEVAKTDTDGEALSHLQLSNAIYTLTFKYNGEVLAILSNVLAKCTVLPCVISVNAYSSTVPVTDFNYINGVNINQNFNDNTKTITTTFISNSGTKTVTLNVTKYDLLGNSTACSSTVTSSSGTLTCVIPDSFGNSTFISNVYSDGKLIKSHIITIRDPNPDDSGSYIILAILIIITLSMLFISDLRGIILGGFLGFILSGTLLYINGTSLFAVGSAGTFLLIFVIILLWKINQGEARN